MYEVNVLLLQNFKNLFARIGGYAHHPLGLEENSQALVYRLVVVAK